MPNLLAVLATATRKGGQGADPGPGLGKRKPLSLSTSDMLTRYLLQSWSTLRSLGMMTAMVRDCSSSEARGEENEGAIRCPDHFSIGEWFLDKKSFAVAIAAEPRETIPLILEGNALEKRER